MRDGLRLLIIKGYLDLSLEVSGWLSLNLAMQLMMHLYMNCINFPARISFVMMQFTIMDRKNDCKANRFST